MNYHCRFPNDGWQVLCWSGCAQHPGFYWVEHSNIKLLYKVLSLENMSVKWVKYKWINVPINNSFDCFIVDHCTTSYIGKLSWNDWHNRNHLNTRMIILIDLIVELVCGVPEFLARMCPSVCCCPATGAVCWAGPAAAAWSITMSDTCTGASDHLFYCLNFVYLSSIL